MSLSCAIGKSRCPNVYNSLFSTTSRIKPRFCFSRGNMTKEPGHRTHGHAVHFSDDAAGLAAIGKTQAFDRRYNLWSVVGIGICVSSTVRSSPSF